MVLRTRAREDSDRDVHCHTVREPEHWHAAALAVPVSDGPSRNFKEPELVGSGPPGAAVSRQCNLPSRLKFRLDTFTFQVELESCQVDFSTSMLNLAPWPGPGGTLGLGVNLKYTGRAADDVTVTVTSQVQPVPFPSPKT